MRFYNSGSFILKQESSIQGFVNQTLEYLQGVTIARQTINRKIIQFLNKTQGDVVEIGGYASLQPYLSNREYISLDIQDSSFNQLTASVECLPFASDTIPNFVCISVLEHTLNPQIAIDEMWRCLKPGGKAFISVPWLFELHMEPQDFYRFSFFTLKNWFTRFEVTEIQATNGYSGLVAHFLQRFLFTRFLFGIWFFWLDRVFGPNYYWATQFNAVIQKPSSSLQEDYSEGSSQNVSGSWRHHLRCPKCASKDQGVLSENDTNYLCQDCGSAYPKIDGKRPKFC
jgi:SAM-dependent methyltransferase/Zn finger protein HypA/HybF involved in hydrogenase expression